MSKMIPNNRSEERENKERRGEPIVDKKKMG